MPERKTPRKTAREIRLEERLRGFNDCLTIFEDLWRKNAAERVKMGLTNQMGFAGAANGKLWEGIDAAQKSLGGLDHEYKSLWIPRVLGTPYPPEEDSDAS